MKTVLLIVNYEAVLSPSRPCFSCFFFPAIVSTLRKQRYLGRRREIFANLGYVIFTQAIHVGEKSIDSSCDDVIQRGYFSPVENFL